MAAIEPVDPRVLAQLVEMPVERDRGDLRRARRRVRARRARVSRSRASPAATATRPIPTRSRTSSGSCSTASTAAVGSGARDAGDRRVQAAGLARAALGDPRRERRRDAQDAGSRGYVEEIGHDPTPGQPDPVRHHATVPRAARARLARRAPGARRLRPRRVDRRGARARPALARTRRRRSTRTRRRRSRSRDADDPARSTSSCSRLDRDRRAASACRRSSRAPASARVARARS